MKLTDSTTHPGGAGRQPQVTQAELSLAVSLIVFLVAATLPYIWLIEHFGYDDILREPAAAILQKFHAGGAPLVLAWFAFAMSSLLFIPVARGFQRLLSAHWASDAGAAVLGIASAIAQAIGLLRWVLVVPALAATFADAQSSQATRDATLVIFDAVHRYGGMVLGELVGQLLLAGWTGLVALALYRSRAVPRWLAGIGFLTLPFWLVGQTELLHGVVPAVPSIEVIPIAFMAWEAWLAAIAVSLLVNAWRSRSKKLPRAGSRDASIHGMTLS
jgi:hypothetical protein